MKAGKLQCHGREERPAKRADRQSEADERQSKGRMGRTKREVAMKTPKPRTLKIECRLKPSRWLKQRILEAQNFACLGCDTSLADVEFDHVVPLGLGGGHAPENWAALCAPCHRKKTKIDLRRIAKANRQRRFHETGRSRAPAKQSQSHHASTFNRELRRHLNGYVSPRCDCPKCRGPMSE